MYGAGLPRLFCLSANHATNETNTEGYSDYRRQNCNGYWYYCADYAHNLALYGGQCVTD